MDPASVEERETRAVRAHGVDPVDLLVNWLNVRLHCLLHGEEAEPARHVSRLPFDAFSTSGATVTEGSGGFEARAITRNDGAFNSSPK